ncbi:ParB-like nuclease domain protein [Mycobacterium phage Philly]|uniref:ParB-like nuclease domain protein n=3 Tax=Pipefishvirus TaxID=1982899 RepID=X2KR64_9CAUD|nr:ParB-like partition protein [Mycobacterium phage Phaedrus]YP_009018515.1 ParB-like partition protein [Mycobacterium phage Akoma]YP_010103794.1 ParB-like partition protein [Mycobacterium phage Obutu]AHN83913.1 ParB-like nuclease domain protein [Mycobacterium phage Audrey]AKF14933.1 hypothetical protein SEA_ORANGEOSWALD_5 [Mycobacterium phage OrangeOswald]AUX82489.1 ParB-like nuclease domain protein [Mycobacterium phage RagingRooster]AVJ49011.1 ParB-like nuclease domain protein [Mycobacteriu
MTALDTGVGNAEGLPRLDPCAAGDDPINAIRWVPADTLDPNAWNPNRVHRPELRLLERSLLLTGWIQPLLVNPDRLIIDGFHRWRLSQDSPAVRKRWRGKVPVAVLDVDRPTAMLMTIRINRAKGTHSAIEMSAIVHELLNKHHLDPDQIAVEIGGTREEVDLLAQDGVFAARDIPNWAYSQAWYPKDK